MKNSAATELEINYRMFQIETFYGSGAGLPERAGKTTPLIRGLLKAGEDLKGKGKGGVTPPPPETTDWGRRGWRNSPCSEGQEWRCSLRSLFLSEICERQGA